MKGGREWWREREEVMGEEKGIRNEGNKGKGKKEEMEKKRG